MDYDKGIGFIGFGIMGKPMVKNLINAGYKLFVTRKNISALGEISDAGATAMHTPAEVARETKIIITMVPDGQDVEDVVLGENGIIEVATDETILVDMSSISPTVTKKIVGALEKKGAQALDAPVSGGEIGAIKGELSIMVGGPEGLFNRIKPIFDVLGKSAVLVGGTGAGQTTKLTNQVLVAIHIQAMGEAFLLATKAGVDPMKVFEAIKGGLAGSNVLNAKVPLMLKRDFKPGFKIRLQQKDVKNALEAAASMGLELPLTDAVQEMISALVARGKGDDDHGGIIQELECRNNYEICET
jgi:2-hydroxy-3-oxopropionate reductase